MAGQVKIFLLLMTVQVESGPVFYGSGQKKMNPQATMARIYAPIIPHVQFVTSHVRKKMDPQSTIARI